MNPLKTLLSICSALILALSTQSTLAANATQTTIKNTTQQLDTCTQPSFDCDRTAILAMQGGNRVSFDFYEVTALTKDYELAPAKSDSADELVVVVSESPNKISLQHLLQVGDGMVVKHWRQDWEYEPKTLWQYDGKKTWVRYHIPTSVSKGKWLQTVWQVDDSPRYASLGAWQHNTNSHFWTGNQTYRPLPRREYSKRKDYKAMLGTNSHDVGVNGWTHLQNNLKQIQANNGSPFIAREIGMNTYVTDPDIDFTDAIGYWNDTAPFWQAVRNHWKTTLDNASSVSTINKVNSKDMYMGLLKAANKYRKKRNKLTGDALKTQVKGLIDPYITATPLSGELPEFKPSNGALF